MSRKQPSLRTKLAATLCQMMRTNDEGKLERIISHEDAKAMSEESVLSLFQFDHWPIRHEMGGPSEHWNLTPRTIYDHRKKSAKKDQPEIAKGTRIEKKQQAFRQKILAKTGQEDIQAKEAGASATRPQARLKSRPMPGTKASGLKKRFNGRVEQR